MAGALKVYNNATSSWEVVDYGPAMRSYSGADYPGIGGTVATAVWTNIGIQSTGYNDTDNYRVSDEATYWYFQVPSDGYYDIAFTIRMASTSSVGELIALIGPDSMTSETQAWAMQSAFNHASYKRRNVSVVKYLAEGSKVKFMCYQSTGGSATVDAIYMSIARLNGAKGDTGARGPAGPTGPTGGGAETLSDLTDVDLTGLTDNEVMRYDLASTTFKPEPMVETVANLTDVDESGKINDSVLRWNTTASKWQISTAGISGLTTAETTAAAWPIGSIFMAAVSTNPATLLGIGTWSAFGTGRMPIGYDAGDSDFNADEKTGGNKAHTHDYSTVIQHNHGISDPTHSHGAYTTGGAGSHEHTQRRWSSAGATTRSDYVATKTGTGNTNTTTLAAGGHEHTTGTYGSGTGISVNNSGSAEGTTTSSSNMDPYIVVHMWKRTA
jgi:hypothetical protein